MITPTDREHGPEFDCHDCFVNAEEAAEEAMLGWAGIVDYYQEFRASCDHDLT